MSDAPQDYENRESARVDSTTVRDFTAERDIKRTVTTSQLILLTIMTSMGIISYFGDRFVGQIDDGFRETNSTLIGIREEMTLIRTGSQTNTIEIVGLKAQVSTNTKNLSSRDNIHWNQPDMLRLCAKAEDINKGWRCPPIKSGN